MVDLSRRGRFLGVVLPLLALMSCFAAHPPVPWPRAPEAERRDVVEGREVYEATVHHGRLWMNTLERHLWELDLTTGSLTRWTFPTDVGHLQRTPSGRLVALSSQAPWGPWGTEGQAPGGWDVLWQFDGDRWSPLMVPRSDEPVHGLVERGQTIGLVSRSSVRFVDPEGAVQRVDLKPRLGPLIESLALVAPDTLYVGGADLGLQPGGLSRINLRTGAVDKVPVGPIAALHIDPTQPECVLAAVTAPYGGGYRWGGIVRVCASRTGWVFREVFGEVVRPPGHRQAAVAQGEGLFESVDRVCPIPGGLLVQTRGLGRVVAGLAETLPAPVLQARAGVRLSTDLEGVLLLGSHLHPEPWDEASGDFWMLCLH